MDDKKGTLLIIDDDESIRKLLRVILEKEGFTVLTESTGYAGVVALDREFEVLKRIKTTLVIVDWMMDGWDGLKTLNEIRVRPWGEKLPIILMSGAVTREQLVQAGRGKANAVILKPIDKDILLAKIQEAIQSLP